MGLILSFILILSTVVRLGFVTTSPPELFGDEIDAGYQAYSLLKTGRDLYNQPLPTYILSLSEWRTPLLMYATVPTIAVFGLTELGIRLPEIIFGSIAPIILFLLVHQTTRNKLLSITSALALSLLPWHLYYSRAAFEVVIMLDLIMLGTLLFLKKRLTLSALPFPLAMYSYSTAIVFVPLWLASLFLLSRRKPFLVQTAVFFSLLIPLGLSLVSGRAQNRFGLLSIFKSNEVVDKILTLRKDSPDVIGERLFHNKIESWTHLFTYNYLRSFSSDFLFVRGDPVGRHSIQVMGQLLPVTAPFLVLGLYYLARKKIWVWLIWLVFAPIPAALTVDGAFHATRLFLMIAPISVAIGAGIFQIINLKSKFINIALLLLFTINFLWFAHFYLVHYPKVYSRWWHVGFKTAMTSLSQLAPSYQKVFINNTYEPSLIRFLFYTKYSPADFHNQFTIDQLQKDIVPGYDGFNLTDKYYFGTFNHGLNLQPNNLYLLSQRDDVGGDWDWRISPPGNIQVLGTATDPYNRPLFYLVTSRP